jgi:uncharacterized protein YkwD
VRNSEQVALPGGGWQRVPRADLGVPVDQWGAHNWHVWFADEFNRLRGIGVSAGVVAREEQAANDAAAQAETLERYRRELVVLVNQERERNGLHSLVVTDEAMSFAQERAIEASSEYSHIRPDGSRPGDWGYNENLARGSNPAGALQSWMNSPGHKSNILVERLSTIGIGVHRSGGVITWVYVAGW